MSTEPRRRLERRSHRLTMALVGALGAFVMVLGGLIYASNSQDQTDQRAAALDDNYHIVLSALDQEQSLESAYLTQPSAEIRSAHAAAYASLVAARDTLKANDDDLDAALLADSDVFLAAEGVIGAAALDAADAGDAAEAQRIHALRDARSYEALRDRFVAAIDVGRADAMAALGASRDFARWLFAATVVAAGFGVALVFVLWRTMRKFESSAAAAVDRELATSHANEERFRALVQNSDDVITILDRVGVTTYASASASRLWAPLGPTRQIGELLHPDDLPLARAHYAEAVAAAGSTVRTELRMRAPDLSWHVFEAIATNRFDEPAIGGLVTVFRDITERKHFESELAHQAFYDALTGLPNRALAIDRLDQAVDRADGDRAPTAVLYLDLDNFKLINDSLGHAAGDLVLVEAARRIKARIRPSDTAARVGGDEFVILLPQIGGLDVAAAIADSVLAAVSEPIAVTAGQEVFVTATIGLTIAGATDTSDGLLRKADLAMYRAKLEGKARVAIFDESMSADVIERLELETGLRRAVERRELVLHYQPIVDMTDGRIREVEALVRWQRPGRGLVQPLKFIGAAERTGLIVPIGQWVLDEALHQLAEWGDAARDMTMSVNLSARQLRRPEIVQEVATSLERAGVAPSRLKLEITESVIMEDADLAVRQLGALRDTGVHLAIDDFGTGHSSLAYLATLPVDTLKIDRSFVAAIAASREGTDILRGIIGLAETMDLHVVAEGVETERQRRLLSSYGCRLAQGYLFARPAPADVVERLLREQLRLAA